MSIVLVGLICSGVIAVMAGVLRRPVVAIPATAVLLVTPLLALPGGSWPPSGWVLVVCDVGQGDGLVLRLGNGRAMVIDTGPDPGAMRQCIRDLEITRVPLLVLTHFHADHVNGLSGVLSAAQVDSIAVTSLADPPGRVTSVRALATQARVPIRIARVGEQGREGDVRWLVLAPVEPPPADSDSPPNDASIVLLVEVRGVRILLLGDEETGSQEILARRYPGLRADVVKVAHHGSAKQDPDLLKSLGAREALISAGRGNSYGLPKASTLLLLQQAGMGIHRTDTDGAQSVVVEDSGRVRVVARN